MLSLPVIDFGARSDQDWLGQLDKACRQWGCCYLDNHGIPTACLDALLSASERFFSLPEAEKRKVERSQDNAWGYYDRELTKNKRDWKEIFDIGPAAAEGPMRGSQPQWPQQPREFRADIEQAYAALEALSLTMLSAIGEALGMPPQALQEGFLDNASSFLRLNHYPPCATPAEHLGISPHTDAGALTLLVHDDQPGLEFLYNGDWHLVEPRRNAIVLNIGDIVQVWSNDRYQAPAHRVRTNHSRHRFSAPFFLNPSYATDYAPLPTACDGEAPRYRVINWGDFRAGRAAGDYADVGEEIQISHFRV